MHNNKNDTLEFVTKIKCTKLSWLPDKKIQEIKEKFSEKALLIFKNQALSDAELLDFAKKIGNGHLEESARSRSLSSSRRHIAYMTNLRDQEGKPLGFHDYTTDYWHSDQEFRLKPASITILHCVMPASEGGNTSFVSTDVQTAGVNNPDNIKKLSALWSTRRPADSHDNAPKMTVAHPVLINNNYLYISENTIDIIQNKKKVSDSCAIKQSILKEILQEKNIYSHQWEVGDLLLFDNSKLLHRREKFAGLRFIKGMKIYPDPKYNSVIPTVAIA